MAASAWPIRQGRPIVSVITTATVTPRRSRSPRRIRRAESSGSAGSSATVPGAVLESSTPAAASTRPCWVSTMRAGPRRATTRTVSASIALSRSARMTRPSALLTILEVITTMSPSARSGAASAIRPARSSPAPISGRPGTPVTETARPGAGTAQFVAGHPRSSWARSRAARAMVAVVARLVMYSGSARTVIPASSGASTAALSCSSTSHPFSSPGP